MIAPVVPAGATTISEQYYLPTASDHKSFGDVYSGQNGNYICSVSFRYDNTQYTNKYVNELNLFQTSYNSGNQIFKKILFNVPNLLNNSVEIFLLVIQNQPYKTGTGLKYDNVYGYVDFSVDYSENWQNVVVDDPLERSEIFFDIPIGSRHAILIDIASYKLNDIRGYSIKSSGQYVSSDDPDIQAVLGQNSEILADAGISDVAAIDYLDEPNTYDPSTDPNSPDFSWTDADGNTFYGKDNPNYKWTDENGDTYPDVSSNFGDDFGAIRGYISEIGSFSAVMSENYESQSVLCSQARFQIDSIFEKIPSIVIVAIILSLLVIVALKILQR